jgi:NAD(P)-dependent dehydrogenase (short-subunit alcohol dehydrogenase family)
MGMMDGRAVLVTGAGRGVGRGIALELAKAVRTNTVLTSLGYLHYTLN